MGAQGNENARIRTVDGQEFYVICSDIAHLAPSKAELYWAQSVGSREYVWVFTKHIVAAWWID